MDKTFEDIIGEVAEELKNENANNESTENIDEESTTEQYDDVDIDTESETAESDDESYEENDDFDQEDLGYNEEETSPSTNEKDAQAFARMRTELKEANDTNKKNQELIDFFDSRAKQMGLSGIDDLIAKTKESEMKKQAEAQGIPLEVLKRLNDLEAEVNNQKAEKENLQRIAKEQAVDRVLDKFVQSHSIDDKGIKSMADSLIKDGFSLDRLSDMPESAINRILSAYLPKEVSKQESIAKKEQIKKEVPPTGNSSSNNNTEEAIDKMARMWAGIN